MLQNYLHLRIEETKAQKTEINLKRNSDISDPNLQTFLHILQQCFPVFQCLLPKSLLDKSKHIMLISERLTTLLQMYGFCIFNILKMTKRFFLSQFTKLTEEFRKMVLQ